MTEQEEVLLAGEMGIYVPREPSYWDEKRRDRREEFKREDAETRERAYPIRGPR